MIGYYVHHQGRGHLRRATAVARESKHPIVALTSLTRPDDRTPFADWVQLARDDLDAGAHAHTAGGALHWAPLASDGYRGRALRLASWLAAESPDVVVVDVSVEVAALCRLLGFPVVVVAGAGERPDAPHTLMYRLAQRILAPWPGRLYRPAHLEPYDVRYVGAFSRFDGYAPRPAPGQRRVLLLWGSGGPAPAEHELAAMQAATPGWRWTMPGHDGTPWCDDVWAALCRSDVVVTHAGMAALAEVAAARRPAVVLPQPRPYGEQQATARALAEHGLAVVVPEWPAASAWPKLLATALARGGDSWSDWNDRCGARHAAAEIAGVLR